MTDISCHRDDHTRHAAPAQVRRAKGRLSPTDRAVLLCGVGSVGRPLALELHQLDVSHLTLVDPKVYFARSVETQCNPCDVDRWKVDVVAAITRQLGLVTAAHAVDICAVPDGMLREGALLISCTDNTRALIRANRLAARMQSPLLKVNIEPLLDCVSVRAYRPCRESTPCAECQLSDRHYEQQTHPHSCDAATTARRTAGSRELATAAAQLALRAAGDILDAGPAADQWFSWETQSQLGSDRLTRSRLERYDNCRWDHSAQWLNMFRLAEPPELLRLEQLVPLRVSLADVVFDFDHSVTRWACCNQCPRRVRRSRWITGPTTLLGHCPACGYWLTPFPFGVRQQATGRELRDVLALPLSDWGVPPGAVIQVTAGGHVRTFVIGSHASPRQHVHAHEERRP